MPGKHQEAALGAIPAGADLTGEGLTQEPGTRMLEPGWEPENLDPEGVSRFAKKMWGLDLLDSGGLLVYGVRTDVNEGELLFLQSGPGDCKMAIAERVSLLQAYRLPSFWWSDGRNGQVFQSPAPEVDKSPKRSLKI